MNTTLPAVPHPLSPGRRSGEGRPRPSALPNIFRRFSLRRLDAFLLGYPPAIALYHAAKRELPWERVKTAAMRACVEAQARPAQSGADHASLAQPVPYHALHGETGEGFEARRARYDLPASVQVALALGFAIPILAIVIVLHGGVG